MDHVSLTVPPPVYSIICMLPAATFLVKSPNASVIFLLAIFGVSVWNGASYYVEVFGRKWVPPLHCLTRGTAH